MSPPALLGNVYAPGGGFRHSPLGGGINRDLVDMAGDPVADDVFALQTTAFQATAAAVASGVADIPAPAGGPPADTSAPSGNGGDSAPGDAPGTDGSGAGGGSGD
jgi:hypothetical protein